MKIREAIVNDLIEKFSGISVENGYLTDVNADDIWHWHLGVFEDDKPLEIINIMDGEITYNGGYQTIEIMIDLGAIIEYTGTKPTEKQKTAQLHRFITNRALDIYSCIQNNYSFFLDRYGYWVVKPINEELKIVQGKRKIAESYLTLNITYKADNKFKVDNRDFN